LATQPSICCDESQSLLQLYIACAAVCIGFSWFYLSEVSSCNVDFFQRLTTICQILMVKSELVSRSFEAFAVLSKMAVTGKPVLQCQRSTNPLSSAASPVSRCLITQCSHTRVMEISLAVCNGFTTFLQQRRASTADPESPISAEMRSNSAMSGVCSAPQRTCCFD